MESFIPNDKRSLFINYAPTYSATIVIWAIIHDIVLITIEPRHFTDYHSGLYPFESHLLLAIEYATVTTFGIGMLFGMIVFALSHLGPSPLSLFHLPIKGSTLSSVLSSHSAYSADIWNTDTTQSMPHTCFTPISGTLITRSASLSPKP